MTFVFFFIALIYSSAGFGGGSMYLAVLNAYYPRGGITNKINGLLCNSVVTLQGSFQWTSSYKEAVFKGWPMLLSAALTCSATAYYFRNEGIVQWAMSLALIAAGFIMLFQERIQKKQFVIHPFNLTILSAVVGILAGMTGIGGGIYLSPILHLTKWRDAKSIATLCSILILTNSIISLTIIFFFSNQNTFNFDWTLPLASVLGGIVGSITGIKILTPHQIKWITAIILIAVGGQFIWNAIV